MTPIALSIAGSDCSAGAGLQADLKTFSAHQVYGLTVVTCVVSETPEIVSKIHAVPPDIVSDQLSLLLSSYPVVALKTGMLYSASHIHAVAEVLEKYPHIQLIVDPVMIASSGTALIDDSAVSAYYERLFPLASLVTPNLQEAEFLLEKKIADDTAIASATKTLSEKIHCSVLLKGGHRENDQCEDILYHKENIYTLSSPRILTKASHGTGCTLSAAIVAQLALGNDMITACGLAKKFINHALRHSYTWGNLHALNQSPIIP